MELSNVNFFTEKIGDFTFGYSIGHASDQEIKFNLGNIQSYQSFRFLLDGANNENQEAIFQIGRCFEFGSYFCNNDKFNNIICIHPNFNTAFTIYKLASEMGSPTAMHQLGMIFEHGIQVDSNRSISIDYFNKAALLGHADSNYFLGIFALKENKTELAYEYFLKAADLGNRNAQFNVAIALYEGDLVWQKNLAMAFGYAKAAHDSNPDDKEVENFMNRIYSELMNEV